MSDDDDLNDDDLSESIREGNVEEVRDFLANHPNFDINEAFDDMEYTPLHIACLHDRHRIVSVLVEQAGIDVNKRDNDGSTPFNLACESDHLQVVKILLRDMRVDINMTDNEGRTPLWNACRWGSFEIIKWMIASGRDVDVSTKGNFNDEEYTPEQIAVESHRENVARLVGVFSRQPVRIRHEVRVNLGMPDAVASETFANVVFLSDGFFRLTPAAGDDPNSPENLSRKFFAMSVGVPMELQMKISNIHAGMNKDNIRSSNSEPAFQSVGWRLALQDMQNMQQNEQQ